MSSSKIGEIFAALDKEQNGFITVESFRSNFEAFLNSISGSDSNSHSINDIVDRLDPNNDGIIYFDDFKSAFIDVLPPTPSPLTRPQNISFNDRDHHKMNSISSLSILDGETDSKTEDSGFHCYSENRHDDQASIYTNEFLKRGDVIRRSWPKRSNNTKVTYPSELLNNREGLLSPPSGPRSDIVDEMDMNYETLKDRLHRMEAKVDSLSKERFDDAQSRSEHLRQENDRLQMQIGMLEERVREVELRAQRDLAAEREHHQILINRLERENEQECENLRSRLITLEEDLSQQKMKNVELGALNNVLKQESRRLTEQLNSSQDTIARLRKSSINPDYSKMEVGAKAPGELASFRHLHKEQLIDLLQTFITTHNPPPPTSTNEPHESMPVERDNSQICRQLNESMELVKRLTQENQRLKCELEEAQEELLQFQVDQGRTLLNVTSPSDDKSWASEVGNLSKEEISGLLSKERETNEVLRKYIEKVIERVIEKNVDVLEITR